MSSKSMNMVELIALNEAKRVKSRKDLINKIDKNDDYLTNQANIDIIMNSFKQSIDDYCHIWINFGCQSMHLSDLIDEINETFENSILTASEQQYLLSYMMQNINLIG